MPVGTCEQVIDIIHKERSDLKVGVDFDVASNPEFLREGEAINNFFTPHCLVVGTSSPRCEELMKKLYHPITTSKRIP